LGSRDVTSHETIRLPAVDFLWVVHSDHLAPLWRYGTSNIGRTDVNTEKKMEEGKEKEEGKGKGREKKSRREKERKEKRN